jgi:hypothetical protein
MDCIGLLGQSLMLIGADIHDRRDYSREPWNDGLEVELDLQLNRVKRPLKVNDIVLGRLKTNGPAIHVGIIAPYRDGNLGIIHTHGGNKKVEYTVLSDHHRKLIVGVYEWAPPDK